jgi:hypothetical protein
MEDENHQEKTDEDMKVISEEADAIPGHTTRDTPKNHLSFYWKEVAPRSARQRGTRGGRKKIF